MLNLLTFSSGVIASIENPFIMQSYVPATISNSITRRTSNENSVLWIRLHVLLLDYSGAPILYPYWRYHVNI